ncbi:hypothetical protein L198_04398 [Cryptococcus wingfieldii CBS 7118]|uniref:D-isomer specific 2-hydroxyacid dehydrogenase NAD-binding domain-containing protein n=1 Tax=Cryptococcus wingfieldii CBS 7118 TaxID=1295528 RepID=A0A1E3J4H3_9TREE|nr:hypothetical protein L198_04398 [Cryptococcus wingfieldii CBS 7118]ODN95780.1 hypothetical protein L198_04398 [Cryptococcus wingfieldii CBS 7118]
MSSFILACTVFLEPPVVERLHKAFAKVHYHPDGVLPKEALQEADILFTEMVGVPAQITDLKAEIPNLKLIQLVCAGSEKALACPAVKNYVAQSDRSITLANASGIHVLSIPNYVVASILGAYHQLSRQIIFGAVNKRWATRAEIEITDKPYYARSPRGRTVGMLGYGALGRESARLLSCLGMEIIAANTSGSATQQTGYIIDGTGDADGSIPETYYSTKDRTSFEAFLKRCDVLVSSLPNTSATQYIIGPKELGKPPSKERFACQHWSGQPRQVWSSEDLLAELNKPEGEGLFAAHVDVTDPEPLPEGHPLWSHRKATITPHLTGDTEGEYDIAVDILIANVKNLAVGERLYNAVDFVKGY